MYTVLQDLIVVEGASFIAAPSCTLNMLQMGATVIRFDAIGGGLDYRRWPKAPNGTSLYWEGLNKGKKSVALDLRNPEGRELALQLATAPGEGRGLFVTNYPVSGFLSHEALKARREDIITVRVMGWADGTQGVDYTANAGAGFPLMTGEPGPVGEKRPVNHVLPAWDLIAGANAAFAMLAAERDRQKTGRGAEIRLPLGDIALTTLGTLGQVAEVMTEEEDRPSYGNDVFGAFGRDFRTSDGHYLMLVALSPRQWTGLLASLGIEAEIAAIEAETGINFSKDEGLRFEYREKINPIVERAVAAETLDALAPRFKDNGVCWEPYRTVREAVASERFKTMGKPYSDVTHGSGLTYPTSDTPIDFHGQASERPTPAPRLGQHTDEVLADFLGLESGAIGRLHDEGIVAGPDNTG
ncbi:CoA transferase [Nisaea sp.]|uniref:CoA transferase n=1 Tax=Nisaea sp. TaxID=2024842 RepID=UPI0032673CFF